MWACRRRSSDATPVSKSMTRHVPSTPKDGSKRALTSVKLSRSNERKRSRRSKTQRHARPKERIKLTSNARLLARSEEFITNLLKEFNVRPTNGDDLFGAVLNAELGKKFCHKRRVDQRKAPHPLYIYYSILRPIVNLKIEIDDAHSLSLGTMHFLYTGAMQFAYLWEFPCCPNIIHGSTYWEVFVKHPSQLFGKRCNMSTGSE